MNYKCEKCSKKFKTKYHLFRHNNRKNSCTEQDLNCPHCKKENFKNIKTKRAHIKNYCKKIIEISNCNNDNKITGNHNIIGNNNTVINNYNIVPFGKENLEEILDIDTIKELINRFDLFQKLPQHINFNDKYPENYNIYKTTKNGKDVNIFEEGKFQTVLFDDYFCCRYFKKKIWFINTIMENNKDKFTEQEIEVVEMYKNKVYGDWTPYDTHKMGYLLYSNRDVAEKIQNAM